MKKLMTTMILLWVLAAACMIPIHAFAGELQQQLAQESTIEQVIRRGLCGQRLGRGPAPDLLADWRTNGDILQVGRRAGQSAGHRAGLPVARMDSSGFRIYHLRQSVNVRTL